MAPTQSLLVALASIAIGAYYTYLWPFEPSSPRPDVDRFSCRPFLPKLFVETPPSVSHPALRRAAGRLDAFLTRRFEAGDMDSLSVGVVTSTGTVFEKSWGVVRGNESAREGEGGVETTSGSSYRIASVSKLFAVLEGLVLEQRGVISW